MSKKCRDEWSARPHFCVEGLRFHSLAAVVRHAKTLGYNGSASPIRLRLMAGVSTWAELAAPVSVDRAKGGHAAAKSKRDEMADVIAALDARKREMGL